MKFALILIFIFLSSCATGYKEPIINLEDTQSSCEKNYKDFIDIFDCLKRDLDTQKNDEIELYLLKGEQLKEKIDLGMMTTADAKYEWKKLLYDIKQLRSEMRYRMMYERACRVNYRGYCVPW
jgi:hypothetical protein